MGTIFVLSRIKKEFNVDTTDAMYIINKDQIDCNRIQKILLVISFLENNQYLKESIYRDLREMPIDIILSKYKLLI